MKKVLITRDIHALLERQETLLNRTGIRVLVAETNDEALAIHRAEHLDLIITQLSLPGMTGEEFCSRIREDADLRAVSIIMVCENTPADIERARQCRANAVLLQPVHPVLIMVKAEQLLDIAARETVRAFVSAKVEGREQQVIFYCRTRNISVAGMLFETDKQLKEGTRLTCLIYLPDGYKIRATGRITRILNRDPGDGHYQYGFMFTDITPDAEQRLHEFIAGIKRESRDGKS